MITSTKAIVLQIKKYSENSLIVNLFTEKLGRKAVIIYNIKNKKNSKLTSFQPLYLLDCIIDNKQTRKIQTLKEYKLSPPLFDIPTNPYKITISLFLSEMINKCLQEEVEDKYTFDFLFTSINIFDKIHEGIEYFHLAFLIKFSKYLGFCPSEINENFNFYDFKLQQITLIKPNHNFFITKKQFKTLLNFDKTPYSELYRLNINTNERNNLLDSIVLMYQLYVINFSQIKSLDILRQIFHN